MDSLNKPLYTLVPTDDVVLLTGQEQLLSSTMSLCCWLNKDRRGGRFYQLSADSNPTLVTLITRSSLSLRYVVAL